MSIAGEQISPGAAIRVGKESWQGRDWNDREGLEQSGDSSPSTSNRGRRKWSVLAIPPCLHPEGEVLATGQRRGTCKDTGTRWKGNC